MARFVKICGLTRPEDVEAAIRYGADFLGFIVEAPSKRKLSVAKAVKLALPAKGIISTVAVTVNPNDDLLTRIIAQMQPDYIQLHGDESPARVTEIGRRFKVKTLKAMPISTPSDMLAAKSYVKACDFILYDAKPPNDSDVRGGHGMAIDWSLIKQASRPKTYLLAGGLTPKNVSEAITVTNAPILDVSSGVEASPGIKDAAKIKDFIKAAKHG